MTAKPQRSKRRLPEFRRPSLEEIRAEVYSWRKPTARPAQRKISARATNAAT